MYGTYYAITYVCIHTHKVYFYIHIRYCFKAFWKCKPI